MHEIEEFVRSIIRQTGRDISKPVEDEMVRDLSERLNDQINRNLIDALPEFYVDELNRLMDRDASPEELQSVFDRAGIDQQTIVNQTFISFAKLFLK